MTWLILILVGLAFTAFAALVFAALTLALGKLTDSFDVEGPDDWTFFDFYLRYLIVAAVYTFVSLPLGNGILGIGALALAYKYVFDAGWTQAIVMGLAGGAIALVLFVILIVAILAPLGVLAGGP
ncbi:MAG: hypothetical protein DCC68_25690 [Planctomycetota bacterium]|nr:MAG: hypothetical protein DCC68_25690 [Planctomycetota bacterium]